MGTDGNDCSVQFFDNRIACDGPNAIPSHPGKWDLSSDRPQFPQMTVLIAKNRNISCCYIVIFHRYQNVLGVNLSCHDYSDSSTDHLHVTYATPYCFWIDDGRSEELNIYGKAHKSDATTPQRIIAIACIESHYIGDK